MFKQIVKKIVKTLHAIIAPPFCAGCKLYISCDTIFCGSCYAQVHPLVTIQLSITEKKQITVFAISDYVYPLKNLIQAKHYKNQIASMQLGELMWNMTDIAQVDFDIIVPIPLHWTRYASRGFNQAQEIASVIAHKSNKPVVSLLSRARRTRFQAELFGDEREQNVKNVFRLAIKNKEFYKGKHILLIDDVMTTGSTIKEAAKILYTLRPSKITLLVACRRV